VLGSLILIAASVLLISNTIRLSIFARRREVEVMKLVGATDWFIRWPFVLEGVVTLPQGTSARKMRDELASLGEQIGCDIDLDAI